MWAWGCVHTHAPGKPSPTSCTETLWSRSTACWYPSLPCGMAHSLHGVSRIGSHAWGLTHGVSRVRSHAWGLTGSHAWGLAGSHAWGLAMSFGNACIEL
eukprot:366212-Chlamydomonas_euryale.AAC.3